MNSSRLFQKELSLYQEASGSLINFRKSQILSWNCNPREMADISKIMGIEGKTNWESFKYLGVPIFKASPKSSPWLQIIDKIKSRISTWGESWLNPAGKVVLIKVVLTSIPIYQCSILLAPKRILVNINSLLNNFL